MKYLSNDFRISPLFNGSFTVVNESLYISSRNYNGLFVIDMVSGELKFIGKFSNQGNFDEMLFAIKNYRDKLICVPGCAQEIAIYDIKNGQIKEVPIEFSTNVIVMGTFVVYENNLYMFPATSDSIIVYNMQDNCILHVIDIAKIYMDMFHERYQSLCNTDSNYIYENNIYIPMWTQPVIAKMDVNRNNIEFCKISGFDQGFCALCGFGDSIYALNKNGVLIEWDIQTNSIINSIKVLHDEEVTNYRIATIIGKHIFLFSQIDILKGITIDINFQTKRKGLPQGISDGLWKLYDNEIIYFGVINDKRLYCYNGKNEYICINLENEEIEWIRDVQVNVGELKETIFDTTGILGKKNILNESYAITVNVFLENINENLQGGFRPKETNIGTAIYRECL